LAGTLELVSKGERPVTKAKGGFLSAVELLLGRQAGIVAELGGKM